MSAIINDISDGTNTHRVVTLSASQWARPLGSALSGWTTLRVAMLYGIQSTGAAPSGYFAFGLCNGSTNMVGDAACNHFIGVANDVGGSAGTWLWNNNVYGQFVAHPNAANSPTAMKKIGTTWTVDATARGHWKHQAYSAQDRQSAIFLTITKSGGTYTVDVTFDRYTYHGAYPTASYNANLDAAAGGTFGMPYSGIFNATGITADEGVAGAFDHVCLWYQPAAPVMWVNSVDVIKLA